MKVKHYEHLFLYWVGYIFAVLAAVSVVVAKADTIPHQPMTVQEAIARTPNNQNFSINVHNGTGSYTSPNAQINFNTDQGRSKQFGNMTPLSDPLKGGKNLNVVIKDTYGNAARGTINTQTQLPSNSALNKAATGYMGATIAGSIVNSQHAKSAAGELARGNYGRAAAHTAAAFDAFGIGSGIYGLFDEYQNAKAAIANPLQGAAQAKAQAAAEAAQAAANAYVANNIESGKYLPNSETGIPAAYPKLAIWEGVDSGVRIIPPEYNFEWFASSGYMYFKEIDLEIGHKSMADEGCITCPLSITTVQVTPQNYHQYKDLITQAIAAQAPKPTLNDFLLNQAEIEAVIAQTLTQMLANQQENTAAIKDLVNMLWQNGQLNPNNTQTTVMGNQAENTFVTAPYTPQGSNQAQQTQFIVHPDGTISTSIIPRPDLAANTSQAPTRQPIINQSTQTNTQNQNTQTGEQATSEQPDICKLNPNSVMCADMGNVDYEDVVLPNEQVDLSFKPADFFASNGTCPAPKQIAFYGNTYFLSYEPMCDFAKGARPMIILLAMVIAMSMVYATVKEL